MKQVEVECVWEGEKEMKELEIRGTNYMTWRRVEGKMKKLGEEQEQK